MRTLLALSFILALAAAGFYDAKTKVINLDTKSFKKEVIESNDLWIVEFYAPWCGHCKNMIPEYIKAAAALEGHAKLGAVDATAEKDLATEYGVNGFPTIKIFGKDKKSPTPHNGGRQARDFIAAARKAGKDMGLEIPKLEAEKLPTTSAFYEGSEVVELNDDTFDKEVLEGKDSWLVEFYAPWCGHCKNLAPEWRKAATDVNGAVRLAAVDATVSTKLAERYGVNGFPTIKFFGPGGKHTEDYHGDRTSAAIVDYCMKKAEDFPSGPVEVKQIENQKALDELLKTSLVGIFIIPHVIDTGAEGRNALIKMFGEIAGKKRRMAFGWISGGDHVAFEEGVGVQMNYPSFVVVSASKKRYSSLKGTFTAPSIEAFLKRLYNGKVPTSAMKEIPKLSKNVPLWDGKDYKPEDDE